MKDDKRVLVASFLILLDLFDPDVDLEMEQVRSKCKCINGFIFSILLKLFVEKLRSFL